MVAGPALDLRYANPAMEALVPLRPELAEHVARVLETGESVDGVVLPAPTPGRWLDFTLARVREGVLLHATDVSSLVVAVEREREARQEAQLAAERTARLQRVADALSAAVGATEVIDLIVTHAQESMGADAGAIALPDGDHVVVGRHAGYSQESMDRWQRFPIAAQLPLSESVRTGELVSVSTFEEWGSRYPDIADQVVMPGLAAVPCVFEGQVLGAMSLSFRDERRFTADDRAFLRALGHQCAQALERARLYEERAYVARTLQSGLLPDALPEVPGMEAAVRYASIADGGEVGGDFYDLFDVAEGRWLAVVGDVCGKGTQAAVLTGLARHTLRAVAMGDPAPPDLLRSLNDALLRHGGDASFCTVVAARIAPLAGGVRVEVASGGHPAPLLVRPDGGVEALTVTGTMLGATADPALEPLVVTLEPGDALVLYTDGVTDARDAAGEDFGEERLRGAATSAAGGGADALADAIDTAVREHQGPGHARDDRAILVLRAAP